MVHPLPEEGEEGYSVLVVLALNRRHSSILHYYFPLRALTL